MNKRRIPWRVALLVLWALTLVFVAKMPIRQKESANNQPTSTVTTPQHSVKLDAVWRQAVIATREKAMSTPPPMPTKKIPKGWPKKSASVASTPHRPATYFTAPSYENTRGQTPYGFAPPASTGNTTREYTPIDRQKPYEGDVVALPPSEGATYAPPTAVCPKLKPLSEIPIRSVQPTPKIVLKPAEFHPVPVEMVDVRREYIPPATVQPIYTPSHVVQPSTSNSEESHVIWRDR